MRNGKVLKSLVSHIHCTNFVISVYCCRKFLSVPGMTAINGQLACKIHVDHWIHDRSHQSIILCFHSVRWMRRWQWQQRKAVLFTPAIGVWAGRGFWI